MQHNQLCVIGEWAWPSAQAHCISALILFEPNPPLPLQPLTFPLSAPSHLYRWCRKTKKQSTAENMRHTKVAEHEDQGRNALGEAKDEEAVLRGKHDQGDGEARPHDERHPCVRVVCVCVCVCVCVKVCVCRCLCVYRSADSCAAECAALGGARVWGAVWRGPKKRNEEKGGLGEERVTNKGDGKRFAPKFSKPPEDGPARRRLCCQ